MNFSIIIPTYNSSKHIQACLDSIMHLDFSKNSFEIIIVDGGSSDTTISIAACYPNVRIAHSRNLSISNSRNIGARLAIGTYLVFVDSDCLVSSQLLLLASKHLDNYQCCGGFYKPHISHGWISRIWLLIENKKFGPVRWITAGTLIVKRSAFFTVGGFSEELQTGEDVDLGLKLLTMGYRILNDPALGSVHLGQPDTLRAFFLKELWRGKSLIAGLVHKKQRLKHLYFDLFICLYFFIFCLSFFFLLTTNFFASFMCYCMLFLMVAFFAIWKSITSSTYKYIFHFLVLIFLYLTARAFSLIYYNQLFDLFSKPSSRRFRIFR